MSFAVLFAHHLTVPALSIGFALVLVATLVTVEEREVRRADVEALPQPRT